MIETVTATVARPADTEGWNWAEAATAAWLTAAEAAGIVVEAQDHDDHGPSVAARVKVDGRWFSVEVGRHGDPDGVQAVEVDTDIL